MTPIEMFEIACLIIGISCGIIATLAWLFEKPRPVPKDRMLNDDSLRPFISQEDGARLTYDDNLDLEPWEIAAMYRRIREERERQK
jgi:hypothetical protein